MVSTSTEAETWEVSTPSMLSSSSSFTSRSQLVGLTLKGSVTWSAGVSAFEAAWITWFHALCGTR